MAQSPINTDNSQDMIEHENTVIDVENGSSITGFISGSPQESTTDQQTTDMSHYENRLRTYVGWMLDFITPSEMAKSGLYYLGEEDRVKCMFCSTEFDNWKQSDDPIKKHKYTSPQCSFFNENHDGVHGVKKDAPESLSDRINNSKKPITFTIIKRLRKFTDHELCTICYKENTNVALVPCGHAITCARCANNLELCTVCREYVSSVMRIHVYNDEKYKNFNQLPSSSSQCSIKKVDKMCCNICRKNKMSAAFIPCNHVHTCMECASKCDICPICGQDFLSTMKVYF